ncbi:MAG TPA: RNA methyltransferase [Solirubrobacteraceae bacterium]|jgi:TrmH family RNA methyltransferase|nr:RNA methyltransferase [Solirubrobacteraceae bacterium]
MTITSHHNQKLKEIRKLRQRRRERERSARFVAEGEDLLAAADAAGWPAVERFCVAGSGLPGVEIEPAVLASVSGLASGTRTLAVYEERWAEAPVGPLCVYLHGVSDPGNVGAVLRSAEAFGASCVVLGPGSADPYSPKAVRASMGAIFTVPVARATGALDALPGTKIALVAGAGVPLADVKPFNHRMGGQKESPPETTLLIGAEREGLPDALTAQADHVAHIPIATHSLNAAMAATVALYELTRMPRA